MVRQGIKYTIRSTILNLLTSVDHTWENKLKSLVTLKHICRLHRSLALMSYEQINVIICYLFTIYKHHFYSHTRLRYIYRQ